MADNVAITAGTGTSIATDDIGGVHFQRSKTALGPEGSHTADLAGRDLGAGVGAAYVDLRPLSGSQSQDSAGLTTATTSYAAGDVLGTGWTFTSMARASGGMGRIIGAALLDDGDVTVAVDLYIASGSITFGTDNAAPSVSDADAAKILNVIGISMTDLGGCRFGSASGLSVPYFCDATSLYVYAVTRAAHSFFAAVDDLHLRLFFEQD
ncbi:MAG TPA: hypothetical protein VD926_15365 [Acidimicrobiales bacterium]|nr:hypothetical protein [Acidimicrobiales bacterium]